MIASTRLIAAHASVLALVLCGGCTLGADSSTGSSTQSFADAVATTIDDAKAGNAGDEQIAILEHAREEGVLTFEDALSAILAEMDCVTSGGGTVEYYEQRQSSGFVIPAYLVLADDDAGLEAINPVVTSCNTRHSFWVNRLYQLQPSSLQVRDAFVEEAAPQMRACLEEHGYVIEPDATGAELSAIAIKVYVESGEAVDCVV